VFEAEDPILARNIAQGMSITYIYVNRYVREKFVKGSEKFDASPRVLRDYTL